MPNTPVALGVPTVPLLNPNTAQIPGYNLQQMQAQRQQQMAAALSEQGMAPIDYDPRGRISWTQGLAKMLSAYEGAKMGNQATQAQAGLQDQVAQAAARNYGFGQPPAGSAGPSAQAFGAALDPRAAAALAQGAQRGSVGPTNANAAAMDAMPAPATPPAPPQPAAGASTPMNPFGAPGMLAWAASQGDPGAQEQLKTWLANQTLTDAQRNSRDPLIGAATVGNLQTQNMTELQKLQAARAAAPNGSPQAQQLDAAIAKANYVAPIEAKQGEPLLNPFTMQPQFFNPKTADGVTPDWSGSLVSPTVAATPGYAAANAANVFADRRAGAAGGIVTGTAPNGAPVTGYGSDVLGGGATVSPAQQAGANAEQLAILQQERAKATNSPADNAALDREIQRLTATGSPTGVPQGTRMLAGPSSTDAAVQKTNAETIANAPAQVAQSKSAITGLEAALRALQTVRATGPGTLKTNDVLAALNNAGVPIATDGVNGYQSMSKFLSNSLNAAAAGTGASGSDARFDSFMHGQPNAETMNKGALDGAIRYVLSQHDANVAKGNFVTQAYQTARAAGDPNAAQTALTQWAQVYNPQVFAFSRMSPADRQAFKGAMSTDQQQQFGLQYNAAHARGWVQ